MKLTITLIAVAILTAACGGTSQPIVVQAASPDQDLVAEAGIDEPSTFVTAPGSKVWFTIDEMFRGAPKTVVGVNPKVAAEVVADIEDPGSVAMGPILIKSAFFDTEPGEEPSPLGDEIGWRDTAINRFILDSSAYPDITFTPADVIDLTEATQGQAVEVGGELTIRDITRTVVFTIMIDSFTDQRVEVSGWAEVLRQDYDLNIPRVAHVAEVADEVRLEFDLIFKAIEE